MINIVESFAFSETTEQAISICSAERPAHSPFESLNVRD